LNIRRLLDGALQKLTADELERRNIIWLIAFAVLNTVGSSFMLGEVFSAWMHEAGLSNTQIGFVGTARSVLGVLATFLFIGVVDRVSNRILATLICSLLTSCTLIALGVAAPVVAAVGSAVFALVSTLVVVSADSSARAVRELFYATMFAHISHDRIRGRVMGLRGVLSFGAMLISGLAVKIVLERFGYPVGYTVSFVFGGCCCIVSLFFLTRLVELPALSSVKRTGSRSPFSAIVEMWKLREFRRLIVPSVAQGFLQALTLFVMPLGIKMIGVPDAYSGYMLSVSAAASVFGMLTLALLGDRWGAGNVILGGCVLSAVGFSFLLVTGSNALFISCYGIVCYGQMLVATGIMLGVYKVAPRGVIGAFNAARTMLFTAGTAVGYLLVGKLLDTADVLLLLWIASFLFAINGLLFWKVLRKTE